MQEQLNLNFDLRPVQQTPPLPADRQAKILRSILSHAQGDHNALTIAQIASALNMSRRATEALLETSIADLGFPIIAGAHGYYIPDSQDDIRHYVASLRSRIKCVAIRIRTVRRAARAAGLIE